MTGVPAHPLLVLENIVWPAVGRCPQDEGTNAHCTLPWVVDLVSNACELHATTAFIHGGGAAKKVALTQAKCPSNDLVNCERTCGATVLGNINPGEVHRVVGDTTVVKRKAFHSHCHESTGILEDIVVA